MKRIFSTTKNQNSIDRKSRIIGKSDLELGLGDYCGQGSHRVEKIAYSSEDEKLHINTTQYFSNVPKDVFDFHIGGYQVLSKYLKSRKGRTLSEGEITNVENVVNILAFTIQHMEKIDAIYQHIKITDIPQSKELRD